MMYRDLPDFAAPFEAAPDSFPSAADVPPRWDMSVVYPSLQSAEFRAGFDQIVAQIHELAVLFDRENIVAPVPGAAPPPVDDAIVHRFETIATAYNTLLDQIRTLRAYIAAFVSNDSRDKDAQAAQSELRKPGTVLSLLATRLTAWVGALDVETLIARSPLAANHAFYLREAQIAARHQMAPGEEELAANLTLAAGSAWTRLYGDVTSQITVPFVRDGKNENLPMSVIRALATDSDAGTRKRAYEAELASWKQNALPLAAAMNAIKHEANILAERRGWESPLDAAVFNNHIDRATLDAMLGAARESFPHFRRYLQTKARLISGAEALPWYDLFAPMGNGSQVWTWNAAEQFVSSQFDTYSPKMGDFARRAFRENWIDAEPREGKRDGAFCMGLRADESRIAQNYRPAFGGVSTLAHELGHGYHNLCLAGRTPLQRGTPMTLAETASIFCETIIRQAALTQGESGDQMVILEASLQGSCQVVVDITSRFLFEERTLEARRKRELSIDELCDLMQQAQLETYGDGLDKNLLHPFMWAAKGHYYGSTFYNFPYMFGLLFGLGLYAQYQVNPDGFHARYDELLSSTGMGGAAELAQGFGFDLRDGAFWSGSLELIRADIDRFELLAKG